MKRLFTIVALGAGLLTGAAIAQAPSPGDAPITQRSIKITAEQGYIIKENVLTSGGTTGQQPGKDIEIGSKVPGEVELKEFPQLVTQRVPATRGFKYFVANNQVVIVSTSDNTVADIIR